MTLGLFLNNISIDDEKTFYIQVTITCRHSLWNFIALYELLLFFSFVMFVRISSVVFFVFCLLLQVYWVGGGGALISVEMGLR